MTLAMPEVEGVRHRMVEAGGVNFHLAEAGPESGVPILLLHGWPNHWLVWRHVIGPLSQDRHVICMDMRGFGWSDAPPGRYDMPSLAADIIALLDALEIDQVDMIGNDWGAWLGHRVCLFHPERVRHFVACNVITPWQKPSLLALLNAWRVGYQIILATPFLGPLVLRRTPLVPFMLKVGAVHDENWDDATRRSYRDVLREPARAQASSRLYRSFLTDELPRITRQKCRDKRNAVPTLLLHGTKDPVVKRWSIGRWEEMGDSMALELRDDAGHFTPEDLPEVVVARARALFSGALPADVAQ